MTTSIEGRSHRSDDMCDAHEGIINGHAEVVHRQAIASEDHKVAQSVCVEPDIASNLIGNKHFLVRRHPEPIAEGRSLHTSATPNQSTHSTHQREEQIW